MQNILFLDPFHVDDPLFLRLLARRLAGPAATFRPLFLVHGSGERAERLLESTGRDAIRHEGVLVVESTEERTRVERGIRESTHRVTAALTEEGVPAVSTPGSQRRLFRSEGGKAPSAAIAEGLLVMAKAGAVPVVSMLLARPESADSELDPAVALDALAAALGKTGPVRLILLTTDGRPGLMQDGRLVPHLRWPADSAPVALHPAAQRAAAALSERGLEVYVSGVTGLGDPISGTRISFQR